MWTAITNNACKFHEDRLKDGVTVILLSKSHVLVVKQVRMACPCAPYLLSRVLMSCSGLMDSHAFCVWAAKKQKRKYISGIAAMTAGQILVSLDFSNINYRDWPAVIAKPEI